MPDLVGVTYLKTLFPALKQRALFFDKIAVYNLWYPGQRPVDLIAEGEAFFNLKLEEGDRNVAAQFVKDIDWLAAQGIVDPLDLPQRFNIPKDCLPFYAAVTGNPQARNLVGKDLDAGFDFLLRIFSSAVAEIEAVNAVPILRQSDVFFTSKEAKKREVIQIVIHALPLPDETTSWEQILEFRRDPDVQGCFLDLRNWINEVSRLKLSRAEVEDKIEYLLSNYQRHMQIQKAKFSDGILETVVTVAAEVLGDLVAFKWGKAAKAIFEIRKKEVSLLEAELKAPGRELAYVLKAREAFQDA